MRGDEGDVVVGECFSLDAEHRRAREVGKRFIITGNTEAQTGESPTSIVGAIPAWHLLASSRLRGEDGRGESAGGVSEAFR